MTDIAAGNHDAFRRARGARCVDEISGRFRRRAERAGVDLARVGRVDQFANRPGRTRRTAFEFCGEIGRDQNALCFGVFETDGDSLDRRITVERQPGRPDLGDGDLGDQKVVAARHPEARDMAGAQPLAHEAPRDGLSLGVDLRVGELAVARHHGDAVGIKSDGTRENLAEQFVADEIGPIKAAQNGVPAKARVQAVAFWRKSFGYRKMRHVRPCFIQ